MNDKVGTLKKWISGSDNIVFFGGAGVSTESGIPDFRSDDGIYNMKYKYPPEKILSHSFFVNHTEEFYKFYRDYRLIDGITPNAAHLKLSELEKAGKLKAVVTQNIDGLHQMAGSKNVLELHGSSRRYNCMDCKRKYGVEVIRDTDGIPYCECGGIIKPDVVLFEESLNANTIDATIRFIAGADVLIIGGTSLAVYPAAGFIDVYSGSKLVLINKSATSANARADLVITDNIGEVMSQL